MNIPSKRASTLRVPAHPLALGSLGIIIGNGAVERLAAVVAKEVELKPDVELVGIKTARDRRKRVLRGSFHARCFT